MYFTTFIQENILKHYNKFVLKKHFNVYTFQLQSSNCTVDSLSFLSLIVFLSDDKEWKTTYWHCTHISIAALFQIKRKVVCKVLTVKYIVLMHFVAVFGHKYWFNHKKLSLQKLNKITWHPHFCNWAITLTYHYVV